MRWLAVIGLGLLTASAGARTLYCTPNATGTAPYTNWAQASSNVVAVVARAWTNDTVLISNGTYYITAQVAVNSNNVTISGMGMDNTKIVRKSGSIRLLYTDANNITIQDSWWSGGSIADNGAGFYFYLNSTGSKLIRCRVHNCLSSGGSGAGICTWDLDLDSCMIDGNTNTAGWAGGIYAGTRLKVENSTLSRNSGGYGGAIGAAPAGGVSLTVLNSVISDNRDTSYGGIFGYGSGLIEDCLIERNQAGYEVGGMEVIGDFAVRRCTIRRNQAGLSGSPFWSALRLAYGPVVEDCDVSYNNVAGISIVAGGTPSIVRRTYVHHNSGWEGYPSGVWFESNDVDTNRSIQSSIIAYNKLYGYSGNAKGAGMYLQNGGKVYNCTFTMNEVYGTIPGVYNEAQGEIVNTIAYGNLDMVTSNTITDVGGDLSGFRFSCGVGLTNGVNNNSNKDPKLVNPNKGNYRIVPNSPAYDKGTAKLAKDFYNKNYDSPSPSMGAVEFKWEQIVPFVGASALNVDKNIGVRPGLYSR